jgi:hypothetical protein
VLFLYKKVSLTLSMGLVRNTPLSGLWSSLGYSVPVSAPLVPLLGPLGGGGVVPCFS